AGDSDRSQLEKAIVAVSLKFQVLCRFTAYVAVDRSQAVNPGGTLHQIIQPVEHPEGWADPSTMTLSSMALPCAAASFASLGIPSKLDRVRKSVSAPPAPVRGLLPPSPPSLEDSALELGAVAPGSYAGYAETVESCLGTFDEKAAALGGLAGRFDLRGRIAA